MSRVLIPGGAGFIGGHLAKALADRGNEVDLLDNFSRGKVDRELREVLTNPRIRLLERDLLDRESLDGLDREYTLIFHLAAIVGVANVLEAPLRVLRENLQLLIAVLDLAARQYELKRLVFASTSEIYAGTLERSTLPFPTPEDAPITVPDVGHPRTAYMLSKLYGESLCLHSGLPVTIIRPHNVYGPRMGLAHVIPELLQRAHTASNGDRLQVYSVDHRRTFCHISDAVEMIVRIAEAGEASGEAFNIGRQDPEVRIGDVAKVVLDVVGRDLEIEPLPAHPGSPPRRCPDMSKTRDLTGYAAKVPLEEGVRDTYDWYRENVFAASAG